MSDIISEALSYAVPLCKVSEGLSLTPYICPAGYPTIGYGTVYKPDGTQVTLQHPAITKEVAEAWLVSELRSKYMQGVLAASPVLLKYPKALGALADFAYNLGVPRYRASTLRRCVNREDWAQARAELLKWVRGSGKVLPGLVRRRKLEARLLP